MPIYEYRCEACGHLLEVLQKISDKPPKSCPACSKRALKRLMSAPRFRLKGAGWYETDFKTDKDKKRNLAESGGDSGSSSTGDGAVSASDKSDKSDKGDKGDKGDKVDKGDKGSKTTESTAASGGSKTSSKSSKSSAKSPAGRKSAAARKRPGGEAA
jgi:putative FmdB family regulatory protein